MDHYLGYHNAEEFGPYAHDGRFDERLDPHNGLLLAAHIDAVFDAGLISFRDDGKMLVSKQIGASDRIALQLGRSLSKALKPTEKKFLQFHRAKVFIDNQ